MDVGSPDMEDGAPLKSAVDLKAHGNKDEEEETGLIKGMQVCADQEWLCSSVPPVGIVGEGLHLPTIVSNSTTSSSPIDKVEEPEEHLPAEADFTDNVEKKSLIYNIVEQTFNVDDHEHHKEKQETTCNIQSGDLDTTVDQCLIHTTEEPRPNVDDQEHHEGKLEASSNIQSGDLDTAVDQSLIHTAEESRSNVNDYGHHEEKQEASSNILSGDLYATADQSLIHTTEDWRSNVNDSACHDNKHEASSNIQSDDLDCSFDQSANDEKILGDPDQYIHEPVLLVGNNSNPQSEKAEFHNDKVEDEKSNYNVEMKENDYIVSVEKFDDSEMFKESSVGHSLPTQNDTMLPSPEELDTKPSSIQHQPPTEVSDRKSDPSAKHTPSPEKPMAGRKRARDSLSPSVRPRSPPGRTPHQDGHHRDSSPRKKIAASPRRRESPRRRGRSTSRSPVRRRDTSGHRRDRRRSRSRSPHVRDHSRRSPR